MGEKKKEEAVRRGHSTMLKGEKRGGKKKELNKITNQLFWKARGGKNENRFTGMGV